MALLICKDVASGLRSSEATVTLEAADGGEEYFPIDRGMISRKDCKDYLTVRLLGEYEATGNSLVGLPVEADSGANRIWVKSINLRSNERFS